MRRRPAPLGPRAHRSAHGATPAGASPLPVDGTQRARQEGPAPDPTAPTPEDAVSASDIFLTVLTIVGLVFPFIYIVKLIRDEASAPPKE